MKGIYIFLLFTVLHTGQLHYPWHLIPTHIIMSNDPAKSRASPRCSHQLPSSSPCLQISFMVMRRQPKCLLPSSPIYLHVQTFPHLSRPGWEWLGQENVTRRCPWFKGPSLLWWKCPRCWSSDKSKLYYSNLTPQCYIIAVRSWYWAQIDHGLVLLIPMDVSTVTNRARNKGFRFRLNVLCWPSL